jgi:hypothetical protein
MQLGLVSYGDGFARWQHILSSIYLAAVCVQLSGRADALQGRLDKQTPRNHRGSGSSSRI